MSMTDIEKAKELLRDGGFTFVALKGDSCLTDKRRGIAPIMDIYEREESLFGYSVADKVVGKAAAFVYVLLGVKELYADVISSHAYTVLNKHGINVSFRRNVDAIINREGTGYCPMESAVLETDDPKRAVSKIKEKLKTI